MSFLIPTKVSNAFLYIAGYDPTHDEATKLEKNLKSLRAKSLSYRDRQKQERNFIQGSVTTLMGEGRKPFVQAVEKGTGPLIQLMETSILVGHIGDKSVIKKHFNPLLPSTSKTKEGHYIKTTLQNQDGEAVKITEAIIFISEFPAVSRYWEADI